MDGKPEEVHGEIEKIREELFKKGYHVAFGVAVREKTDSRINMYEIVKEAESNMYAAKKEFYLQPENNRKTR